MLRHLCPSLHAKISSCHRTQRTGAPVTSYLPFSLSSLPLPFPFKSFQDRQALQLEQQVTEAAQRQLGALTGTIHKEEEDLTNGRHQDNQIVQATFHDIDEQFESTRATMNRSNALMRQVEAWRAQYGAACGAAVGAVGAAQPVTATPAADAAELIRIELDARFDTLTARFAEMSEEHDLQYVEASARRNETMAKVVDLSTMAFNAETDSIHQILQALSGQIARMQDEVLRTDATTASTLGKFDTIMYEGDW